MFHVYRLLTVIVSAVFLLVVAAVFQYAELYVMSAAIITLPVISFLIGKITIGRLKFQRELPEYVQEDQVFTIKLKAEGGTGFLGPIEFEDNVGEWLNKDTPTAPVSIESLNEITYTAQAKKRGAHTLGPLKLKVSDPLGFFNFANNYPLYSELTVWPRAMRIPELTKRSVGNYGEYQYEGEGTKGKGADFHGVREYQYGDDLRRVHWLSTAKRGNLTVMEFEYSRAQDAVIAIDLQQGSEIGEGMYSTLEYAIRLAAGIAEDTLMLGSSARLICDGFSGEETHPGKGSDQLYTILNALAKIEANSGKSISEVLAEQAEFITANTTITCFVSRIDENVSDCLEILASKGARAHVILLDVEGSSSVDIPIDWSALASNISISVVQCATDSIQGFVSYEYSA